MDPFLLRFKLFDLGVEAALQELQVAQLFACQLDRLQGVGGLSRLAHQVRVRVFVSNSRRAVTRTGCSQPRTRATCLLLVQFWFGGSFVAVFGASEHNCA